MSELRVALFGGLLPIILGAGQAYAQQTEEGAFRNIKFAEAQRVAAAENKPIFIDFYTTWCAPCKMMDRITFKDEKVVEWLRTRTVSIKVDAERERDLARRYEIRSYPTLILLGADGNEHARHSGYLDANGFMRMVQRWESIAQSSGPVVRPEAPRAGGGSSAPSDDLQDPFERHRRAKSFVQVGRNHEALEDFLWCFDHGAQADAEFATVRNQELLDDIREFGRSYAPATAALRDRLEALEARIRGARIGQRGLKDYVLLTHTLSESGRVLTLFDSMLEDEDLKETRSALLPFILPALVEQKRYSDVARSVSDPSGALQKQLSLLQFAREQGVRPRQLNALRDDVLQINGLLFEALLGAGREREARRIADLLTQADSRSNVYAELIRHARRAGNDELASQISARALLELDASEHAGILDAISPKPVVVEKETP